MFIYLLFFCTNNCMIHYFDFHVNATSLQFNFVTLSMTSERQLAISYNAKYHVIIACYRKVYVFYLFILFFILIDPYIYYYFKHSLAIVYNDNWSIVFCSRNRRNGYSRFVRQAFFDAYIYKYYTSAFLIYTCLH